MFSPNAGKYRPEKTLYLGPFHAKIPEIYQKDFGRFFSCSFSFLQKYYLNLSDKLSHATLVGDTQ